MKHSFWLSFILAVAILATPHTLFAGTNVFSKGTCSNGRTWWVNVEINDDGTAGCIIGMDCSGAPYRRNCTGSLPNDPWTNVTAVTSGSAAEVTVSSASGLRVYAVATGALVYTHSGSIPADTPTSINTSSWGAGAFILVAFNPTSDAATGCLALTL